MNLFGEFPIQPLSAWEEQAKKELKGADPAEKLLWHTPDGFAIEPFFTDLPAPDWEEYLTESMAAAADAFGRHWRNRLSIEFADEKAANALALDMLNRNVNEIAFDAAGKAARLDLETLLQGIELPFCAVSWQLNHDEASEFLHRYFAYAESKGYARQSLSGRLDLNGKVADERYFTLADAVRGTAMHAVVISSEGTTVSERWASALAAAYRLLRKAPQPEALLRHMAVSHTLSDSYFTEIAGMRAFRLLLGEAAAEFMPDYNPALLHIAARTSFKINERNRQDPYWNMISNTTQAMSAVIGGCNTLEVTPHQKGIEPVDGFGQRIAVNISNILAEEAYFGKSIDPAAGAYYIEQFTEKMLAAIWEKFREKVQPDDER